MNKRERGELFRRYVGLELKGAIQSRGRSAKDVAEEIGRADETFNRWLNDKKPLPVPVLCAACEAIGIEPKVIVERAYDRMVAEMGEPGSETDTTNVVPLRPRDDLDDSLGAVARETDPEPTDEQ